jgi:hypothetical protein
MNPPRDGDDVAKVTPLRRREPHLVGLPKLRDPLPAERAAFDPELEPADVQLRRTRRRQARNGLELAARRLRPRLAAHRIRPALVIAVVVGCAVTAAAAALIDGAGSGTRPHRTTASSALKASKPAPKVSLAETPRRRAHQPVRHAVRHVVHHPTAQQSKRDKARLHPSAHASSSAAPTEPTETTSTPSAAPPTPVLNSSASTQSAEASQSSSPSSKSPAGPTGSGAAFGPGY